MLRTISERLCELLGVDLGRSPVSGICSAQTQGYKSTHIIEVRRWRLHHAILVTTLLLSFSAIEQLADPLPRTESTCGGEGESSIVKERPGVYSELSLQDTSSSEASKLDRSLVSVRGDGPPAQKQRRIYSK